jgi:hypothetical protein
MLFASAWRRDAACSAGETPALRPSAFVPAMLYARSRNAELAAAQNRRRCGRAMHRRQKFRICHARTYNAGFNKSLHSVPLRASVSLW